MKLFAFILLLIVNVPVLAQTPAQQETQSAQPRVADPMRILVWGLPQDAVKEFETAEFVGEEQGVLVYNVRMRLGPERKLYQTMVEYRFDKNGLNRILYSVPMNRANAREAVADAMIWQGWLDAAFEQESRPEFSFQNPRIYDDPLRWGGAIYRRQGHIRIDWLTAATRARLDLSAYSGSPRLNVTLAPAQTSQNP